jgi:cysteinyl-tRNA synthetase
MIDMVRDLVKKGYAYENNGSVYFSIQKFKEYGKLSHLDMKGIKIGARIAADEYAKDNPRDFVLMKRSTTEELKRGIFYETEWGKVRPGWHIECSLMVLKYLGETIDIHTGGVDLIFPHHENEIAQSEAHLGKKSVNYWIHNEHLLINGEKMSKSLDNIITLEELVKKFSPEVVRYMFLSVHRRQKLNYTEDFAKNSKRNYERLKESFDHLNFSLDSSETKKSKQDFVFLKKLQKIRKQFLDAMDDDLNTPLALTVFYHLSKEVNKYLEKGRNRNVLKKALKLFEEFSEVFGLQFKGEGLLPKEIEELIKTREEARKKNDFEAADKIRQQIKGLGYIIEDTEKGTRWKKVK